MLPNRVTFSQKATDRLRFMKSKTGLTPNILARIAIMMALKEDGNLLNAGVSDNEGQELNKSVLFGEYMDVYDVMIHQYIHDNAIELPIQQVIVALVEMGVHKMGHVKKLEDLCQFV